MSDTKGSIESRYLQLVGKRQPYLDRARAAASYTIPSLFPPEGSDGWTNLPQPYNNIGAEGINNLAAKLLLSQMAPNNPFFRLRVDEFVADKLAGESEEFRTELEATFAKIERAVQTNIEMSGDRTAANEAFKQLLVAGNVLCFLPKDGTMRVIRLDQYVVARDPDDNIVEIIVKECASYNSLPEDVQAIVAPRMDTTNNESEKFVDIYTYIKRTKTNWTTRQEIKGMRIPDADGSYPLEESPYIVLRYCRVDSEDYGRGFVEEYIGDLQTLDGLSQSIKEGSIASARVIPLVSPNGTLRPKDLEKPNGTPVIGEATDLTFVQVNKQADLSVALQYAEQVERRLQRAFLLFSGVQRDAERVTAEEIRAVINELEERMGGFYSILAQEFQLPYVKRKMFQMKRAGLLPELPKGIVHPTIVTGLQALGRGQELTKMKEYLAMMSELLGPAFTQYVNVDVVSNRVATALAFDDSGIMKSREQVAEEAAAAQQAAMEQKAAAPMVNQMGNLMQGAMQDG